MSVAETDALGRLVELREPPRRIVSVVPSLTELFVHWGLMDRLAGRTTFCVEPPEAVAGIPRVGGTKQLKLDRITAMAPDLVVASAEENERADIEELMARGLPVFVTLPATVREAVSMLRPLGRLLGKEDEAERLVEETETALREIAQGPQATVFCPIWRNPYMTCAPGTYMHDFLETCGGQNIFADASARYPQVTLEEVAERNPAVILLPDEPFPFAPKHLSDFDPFREKSLAFRTGNVHFIDGKLVSWYGPRMPSALRSVAALIRRAARG